MSAAARGLNEVRLYTNAAMTENLTYYPRHGYRETHRATQDGYRRVFFTKAAVRVKPEVTAAGTAAPGSQDGSAARWH